jgi:hypothetical protein
MHLGFYDWRERFNHEGLTYGLRLELLQLLKPHVRLKPAFRLPGEVAIVRDTNLENTTRIKDLVDWEIILGTSDVHEILRTHPGSLDS